MVRSFIRLNLYEYILISFVNNVIDIEYLSVRLKRIRSLNSYYVHLKSVLKKKNYSVNQRLKVLNYNHKKAISVIKLTKIALGIVLMSYLLMIRVRVMPWLTYCLSQDRILNRTLIKNAILFIP